MDQQTGYRRYATDQIPAAQVIRRFRRLDMPLDEIQAVLAAPDLRTRNDLIAAHLSRLEEGLARTQSAVASLRDLLQHPSPAGGIFSGELFTRERGQATIFIPCAGPVRPLGRVTPLVVPGRRAGDHRATQARIRTSTAPTARWPPT